MVQKFQSDEGGGGRKKQRTLLANKTRGLATRKGREIEIRSWGEEPSEIVMETRDEDEGVRG